MATKKKIAAKHTAAKAARTAPVVVPPPPAAPPAAPAKKGGRLTMNQRFEQMNNEQQEEARITRLELDQMPTDVKARKPPKEKPSKECVCGCGGLTKSDFVAGHDQRVKTKFILSLFGSIAGMIRWSKTKEGQARIKAQATPEGAA